MDYKFVVLREAVWAGFVAVVVVLLQALVGLDDSSLTDVRTWVIGLSVAAIRAGAAAVLAVFTKGFIFKEESPANPQG